MIYINKYGKLVGTISLSDEIREYEVNGVYKSNDKEEHPDSVILGFTYII